MSETIIQAAALIVPLIIAIVFHEVAHGWTARALGDPTAANLGRLSLNPIKHVDPFGTIILPAMLKLAGMPMFGWAKPVPVIKGRLRNPRRDMMIVAAAGPGSNLVMGLIGAVALGLLLRPYAGGVEPAAVMDFVLREPVQFHLMINVFLALVQPAADPAVRWLAHRRRAAAAQGGAAQYAGCTAKALLIMILLIVVLPTDFTQPQPGGLGGLPGRACGSMGSTWPWRRPLCAGG
jgi:Zn-dependent protease